MFALFSNYAQPAHSFTRSHGFRMGIRVMAVCLLFATLFEVRGGAADDFYAYHTRLQSGQEFERYSRTGDAADIVINIGSCQGRLVFWRGTSYLPYWETANGKFTLEEIVPRHGDGDKTRPDRINAFSHVALVESTAKQAIVSWRYLSNLEGGNPRTNIQATNFVEEYFTITPKGKVTRVIKQATAKIDDWNDPLNQTTQVLQLSPEGVRQISRTQPTHSPAAPALAGAPIKNSLVKPIREWRLDQGTGDQVTETVTGTASSVPGHKTLWRRGVSGTCLQFDGYNTVVTLSTAQAPTLSDSMSLEAWIVIGAYPWNWCPIVQQGEDDGYCLGVDAHAHAGFKLKVGDTWQELVCTNHVERFTWNHVVGAYDRSKGLMTLYLNGQAVASKSVGSAGIKTANAQIQIGKGKPRTPADPVGYTLTEAEYAFDGLIDEVRIYDQALTSEQVASTYKTIASGDLIARSPDLEPRALPRFNTGNRFGAHYTRLKYYDVWDNLWRFGPYADVVVGFDLVPTKFIFWRGTGDIPMVSNGEDQWYSNEFNETWNRSGGIGCMEPMSDKRSFFNHVRVIENTPARVIVHWRFPLIDVRLFNANYHKDTGWGDWSDWYYYIYPDGVAVKNMHLWTDGPRNHEFQESMAIMGPNQHPEQILETNPALILADSEGNATEYSWTNGPPTKVDYTNKKVHIVNFRSKYDAFTIGNFTKGDVYGGELTPYSVFPSWNHWPVAQVPSDGRYASFPDRAAHSSLTHVFMPDFRADLGDRPFEEKLLMEGMSSQSPKELARLARSWLQAPAIQAIADCADPAFDPSQRAYVVSASGPAPSFQIAASDAHPIVNPCFVVRNWNSTEAAGLEIDSKARSRGTSFRQGIERDVNGHPVLVVWLQLEASQPVTFKIKQR